MSGISDDQRERLKAIADRRENGEAGANRDWLLGSPMDPAATPPDPLPPLAGFPFLHPGTGAVIVGPTGGGRSSLIQAGLYDAAKAGLRCAYLGHEVIEEEFNARAANLAGLRGDELSDQLRGELARVRYLDLTSVIAQAWEVLEDWVAGICASYDIVAIDPLSAVESALGLNFEQSNTEFVRFYDRLVKPITSRGVQVTLIDNVGHAAEAQRRAKGASAKSDRADLTFSCALAPGGLAIRAHKVRTIRTTFRRGDEWLFDRESQTIEYRGTSASERTSEGEFRPTHLMEKASRLIEGEPGVTTNVIKKRIGGKADRVATALRHLVAEGHVERRDHGQAQRHYSLRPYRESHDPKRDSTGSQDAGTGTPAGNLFEQDDRASTGSRESPATTGLGTGSHPSPDRVPEPVPDNRVPKSRVRSTGKWCAEYGC